mmetsp:Transcript_18312/g.59962  ORF Transcript_18312/g.59962 Transcript_18312/m.59962 type:complete len:248 (-) Transcript_18312:795-1538(-)
MHWHRNARRATGRSEPLLLAHASRARDIFLQELRPSGQCSRPSMSITEQDHRGQLRGGHDLWCVVVSLRESFRLRVDKCSLKADTLGFGSTSTMPIRQLGSSSSSCARIVLTSRGVNARTMPVMVKRFSSSCFPGRVTTAWWQESAVMSSDMSASGTQSLSRTPGSSPPCRWISAINSTSGSDPAPRAGSVGRILTDMSSWLVSIFTTSGERAGSDSISMTVTKSSPTLYIFASSTLHSMPRSWRDS